MEQQKGMLFATTIFLKKKKKVFNVIDIFISCGKVYIVL